MEKILIDWEWCRKKAEPLKGLFTRLVVGRHLELGLWGGSHHSQNCYSLCLNFVQNSMVLLNSCFPSGSLEFGLCHRETMRPAPSKNLGTKFPWWTTIHACCHNLLLGGIKHTLCDFTGRKPWRLEPGFPRTLLNVSLPFTFLVCILWIRVKSYPQGQICADPSRCIIKTGCALGDPWHKRRQVMISSSGETIYMHGQWLQLADVNSYHVEPPFIILFSMCKN